MYIERGSTWNRWDFHVHTPYSILNNQFGFNPDPGWQTDIAEFDEYVKTLFSKAVEKGVVAIGITDYFSIDGYKRIREAYLNKPEKMKELFPNEELRSKIERIYVFPNIEFRIPTFIGKKANAVNYHVIFSDKVTVSDIETTFLCQIQLQHNIDEKLPLCRNSIERIGAEYKRNNDASGTDYHVGLDHITVDENDILKLLKNKIFEGSYFISIPVDEDLSKGVTWKGRDSISRKLLCQQSHCFMTSNDNTRDWALGRDGIKAQIDEFGSLKPCIWGSDAHSYDRMFCPDNDRFCWIKAEATFEGLQQILYEPADRVRIQSDKPEEKDEHQIIDYIVFDDDDFSSEPIYFSEGLTCIIGGKSTGKSILLRHVAKSIDPKNVAKRDEEIGETCNLSVNATVTWKDGESGERKIVYIPQSWLNRTVDKQGSSSEINKIIQEVLLQNEQIARSHRYLMDGIAAIMDSVKHDILSYVTAISNAAEKEELLKAEGRSKSFIKPISDLESKRKELTEAAGITQEDIARYGELEKEEIKLKQRIIDLGNEHKRVNELKYPFVYIEGCIDKEFVDISSYDLKGFPTTRELFESVISQMNEAIKPIWEKAMEDIKARLTIVYEETIEKNKRIGAEIDPLRKRIAVSEDLKKIEQQLSDEREKQKLALLREKERDEFHNQAEEFRKKIIQSRESLIKKYGEFSVSVRDANQGGTELEFGVKIDTRKNELYESINSIFNTRNFRAFNEKYGINLSNREDFEVTDDLFSKIFTGLEDDVIACKGGFTVQTALEQLFSDWFYVHYIVMSEGDTIDTMSPGKKALVLLELIVNLEKGKCPILIDQPEDDLDNRSIYTELVKYLKEKKHERQIIVVTHNANVVVGADAEEVIIANQSGKEAKNYSKRFEYRCGAIENVSPIFEGAEIRKGVLNQKGIQEQICDILEGGEDAFKKRASKYLSRNRAHSPRS